MALQPRTFDLLVHLVSHAGKLVTRDDLFEAVWGEVHVSEAALTQAVAALRRVLGDTGVGQSLVRTVRGRGYRFAAAVRFESEELYKAS